MTGSEGCVAPPSALLCCWQRAGAHDVKPSQTALLLLVAIGLVLVKKICKIFQIHRHIESLDVYMKY